MRHFLPFLLFLFCLNLSFSQSIALSPESEISVLTIGPGHVLNDAFGHNGFRINDPTLNRDLVFNYGVYDFDDPNFYLKFAQGKLNYKMGLNDYEDFFRAYKAQNRRIQEQILNLDLSERQKLFDFLLENFKPENRYYLYDFFYDNCATKIRDVVEQNSNGGVTFENPGSFESKTFRQLIYEHVPRNSWGSLGIDLALGSVIDQEATAYEHMYLPKYIHSFFQTARFENGDRLVKSDGVLFEPNENSEKTNWFISPVFILLIISLVIIVLTFRDYKNASRRRWLDSLIMLVSAIGGIVMFLLWFATDHTATAFNYNMLWAFPFNLLLVLPLLKKRPKPWIRKYLKFLILLLVLMGLHWMIGVQLFAISLLPLMIALLIRYSYLIRFLKD